ncbi:MAG TPA: hypothetical protein VKT99_24800 [Xanthobacteraceae bacterium]|jgi:hypothetical protein|nr:hypothetical protein [Xanthobacteraceae bacterium]
MDQIKAQGSSTAAGFPDGPRESVASSMGRSKEEMSGAVSETDAGGADFKALQKDLSDVKEALARLMARGWR